MYVNKAIINEQYNKCRQLMEIGCARKCCCCLLYAPLFTHAPYSLPPSCTAQITMKINTKFLRLLSNSIDTYKLFIIIINRM